MCHTLYTLHALHTLEKKRRNYEPHQLMEAVEDVKRGLTISEASRKHGVPRKTLSDYVRQKPNCVKPMGGPRMLSNMEEAAVVEYILYMSDRGLPLSRDHLRSTICVRHLKVCQKQCNAQIINIFHSCDTTCHS